MGSYRLTVCDHYLSPPICGYDVTYSDFKGSDVKQVPIIRIFGTAADDGLYAGIASLLKFDIQ